MRRYHRVVQKNGKKASHLSKVYIYEEVARPFFISIGRVSEIISMMLKQGYNGEYATPEEAELDKEIDALAHDPPMKSNTGPISIAGMLNLNEDK